MSIELNLNSKENENNVNKKADKYNNKEYK